MLVSSASVLESVLSDGLVSIQAGLIAARLITLFLLNCRDAVIDLFFHRITCQTLFRLCSSVIPFDQKLEPVVVFALIMQTIMFA